MYFIRVDLLFFVRKNSFQRGPVFFAMISLAREITTKRETISWQIHERFPCDETFIGQWDELAESRKPPSIFLSYDWLAAWWEHFGKGKKLFLLAGFRQNRLIALAPLMISKKTLLPFLSCRMMERLVA